MLIELMLIILITWVISYINLKLNHWRNKDNFNRSYSWLGSDLLKIQVVLGTYNKNNNNIILIILLNYKGIELISLKPINYLKLNLNYYNFEDNGL